MKRYLLMLMATASISAAAATAQLGYTNGSNNRDNIFRLGNTERQGIAIKFDNSKLQSLRGARITGISATFGSSRTNDGNATLFIATELGGEPVVQQVAKITRAVNWLTFDLENPYVITGDEQQLYVGYFADISANSNLLMSDYSADDMERSFAYSNGRWVDMYGLGCGNANVRAIVDGCDDFADLMVKPVALNGYYVAECDYPFVIQLFNFGNATITSFDMTVRVGDGTETLSSFANLNMEPASTFDIAIDNVRAADAGQMPVTVTIANVNGADDADMFDNTYAGAAFFYPADMERNILLESFTGTDCGNCPAGHSTIRAFEENELPIPLIEVMHHAGYMPDMFTMNSDLDYTFFYGSTQNYAPAFMLNRTTIPTVGVVPVMQTTRSNLTEAYNLVAQSQPYVSLSLESSYDPATRQVNLNFGSYAHRDLPQNAILNVMLIQNGIGGPQSGAPGVYNHNAVFRGCLTGNSWGILLNDEATVAGGSACWEHSFTLPETILSDYWDPDKYPYFIPTDPDNMYLVAYIASWGDNGVNDHVVHNSVRVKLGESYRQGGYSGINSVIADDNDIMVTVVDGHIRVSGDVDSVQIYDLSGKAVNPAAALHHGIYIVRANRAGRVVTRKVRI